jgi:hypothetical protein
VPCTCSVAAPPWAQVLGLCPGLPRVQAREPGRMPCSHRIRSLAALHGILGRRVYSGGEWVHFFFFFRRDPKKIFEGNAITFLIPRTTLSFFFAILTTHRRNFFSALEGLLRPGALASIGLGGGACGSACCLIYEIEGGDLAVGGWRRGAHPLLANFWPEISARFESWQLLKALCAPCGPTPQYKMLYYHFVVHAAIALVCRK